MGSYWFNRPLYAQSHLANESRSNPNKGVWVYSANIVAQACSYKSCNRRPTESTRKDSNGADRHSVYRTQQTTRHTMRSRFLRRKAMRRNALRNRKRKYSRLIHHAGFECPHAVPHATHTANAPTLPYGSSQAVHSSHQMPPAHTCPQDRPILPHSAPLARPHLLSPSTIASTKVTITLRPNHEVLFCPHPPVST